MRILFFGHHCPVCYNERLALLFVNPHLPVGEWIDEVDVRSGDPRVRIYDELRSFGVDKVITPVMIIDKSNISKTFSNSYIESVSRILKISSFGNRTTERFLLSMLDEEVI